MGKKTSTITRPKPEQTDWVNELGEHVEDVLEVGGEKMNAQLTVEQQRQLAGLRYRGAQRLPEKEQADFWFEATLHIDSEIYAPQILADEDPMGALFEMIYNTRNIGEIARIFG